MHNRIPYILGAAALLGLGIFLGVIGVIQFDRIADMEAVGHVSGLSSKVKFVYAHLGKWGVLGAYEFAGVCVLLAGGEKLWSAFYGQAKDQRS